MSPESQVITQLFQAKGSYVASILLGHNAIVKFSSVSIEETTAPAVTNCWYYYDIDKFDLKTEGTFNIIFNNGSGIQTETIERLSVETSVYYYDFWEKNTFAYTDDEGNECEGSYLVSSPSERDDKPSEQPAEGFIRIYFYSELLETETSYLHYWESVFTTKWPGVQMIKFE